jgi:hypothetical protein
MMGVILGASIAILGAETADTPPPARLVLVLSVGADGQTSYECGGRTVPKADVVGCARRALEHDAADAPVFVLLSDTLPVGQALELGAVLEGQLGLKAVRYFVFSRQTGVMMGISPDWRRWKLNFDGMLQPKPW